MEQTGEAKMQVLLVDDNALQACTREAILVRSGIAVIKAQGAEQALSILEDGETGSAINLIVTDHLMPGINGAEFARMVRSFAPNLPILVLSGMPDADAEYADLGVVFQLKPFPPPEFLRLVKSMGSRQSLRSA